MQPFWEGKLAVSVKIEDVPMCSLILNSTSRRLSRDTL